MSQRYDAQALRREISRDEGRRRYPYKDSEGILTIGVGHNLEEHGLPEHMIDELLDKGISAAKEDLSLIYPGWKSLSDARQRVLINMCFNLGKSRLEGFRKMWAAIRAGDYDEAAVQMLDSRWAEQVGPRATRLAQMMRDG